MSFFYDQDYRDAQLEAGDEAGWYKEDAPSYAEYALDPDLSPDEIEEMLRQEAEESIDLYGGDADIAFDG